MIKIKTALISVSDKSGLESLVPFLSQMGISLIATGGTAQYIKNQGYQVEEVSQITNFPEILGGRVKTLHPKIEGAILARRDSASDIENLNQHHIKPIDLVICNLYPFQKMVQAGVKDLNQVVEEIDIGGVTLLRAAAKNFRYVVVVSSPDQYPELMDELKKNQSSFPREKSQKWAIQAFFSTSQYDAQISNYLSALAYPKEDFPPKLIIALEKKYPLRYGENPHQKAAFYRDLSLDSEGFMNQAEQLGGKELSFNNIFDTQSAFSLVREFEQPAVVVLKHNNPCGVAIHSELSQAAQKALASDPLSAFGGIVALNRTVDKSTASVFQDQFIEVIIAPDFEKEAQEVLSKKKNLRILRAPLSQPARFDSKKVDGGFLIQDADQLDLIKEELQVVTSREPKPEEWEDLLFAWKVAKYTKSNAIILAKDRQTVGVGAGQMSRIDALKIALIKSENRQNGAVLASDAFFPFPDVVEEAAQAGILAIIQPGGSIRDQQSIEACNRLGLSMVFTGIRHFRH